MSEPAACEAVILHRLVFEDRLIVLRCMLEHGHRELHWALLPYANTRQVEWATQ